MLENKPLLFLRPLLLPALIITGLAACSGGSDDDDDNSSDGGYIALYNASVDSPAIFLTLDEDLTDEDDDALEQTYSSVSYSESSGYNLVDDDTYTMELAWNSDNSTARDDLTIIYQDDITITDGEVSFVVLAGGITSPTVLTYNIPVIDEDDDDDNDLFNMRLLNMHPTIDAVDVYLSKSDETFNEAQLLGSFTSQQLSENEKYDQDDYIFYMTLVGSSDVVFTSDEISYSLSSQYVMVIRENQGVGTSPFVLDRVSTASAIEYANDGSQSRFKVFNAIESNKTFNAEVVNNDFLTNYNGLVDVHVGAYSDTPQFASLAQGAFSESIDIEQGDYSVNLTISGTEEYLLQNHLVTLTENVDRSVFFYLSEENVDHDNDGDVDENGDGMIDEIDVTINSLVVDNSVSESIYDTNINIINFIDDDDFSAVNFYFVLNDEIIDTATNVKTASFGSPASITLLNNTYTMYAVASRNSSDVILMTQELVLDEDSNDQFLLLEEDSTSSTGYKITFVEQAQ